MNIRRLALSMSAAVLSALMLSACGGGNAEAPPDSTATTVAPAAPVVTITNNVAADIATGDIVFTFSFNRDVGTSFTADDVTVTGGTKGAFTRNGGTSATLVVTPTANAQGLVQLSVAANAVSDAVGTGNAAVTAQKAFDTRIPVVRTRLVTFEETTPPTLTGFGGAEDSTVVTDPTDPANKVAKVVKSATAELWAGTTVSICPQERIVALPFNSTNKKMSVRVWSPAAGVPVRLKVENAANGAQSAETEATTTVASAWETLTFDFATPAAGTAALNTANTYDKVSIFFNFGTPGAATGARTYYFDEVSFVGSTFTVACPSTGGGSTAFQITMDESPAPTLTGFGGAEDSTIATDPAGGTNKVARVLKSATAELWAGTTVSTLPNQALPTIPFATGATTITVRVWSPAAGVPVRLKAENASDATKSVETEATTTASNAWETLSFNFANQVAGTAALNLSTTYNKLSIFFNFGTPGSVTGARTYFFEDITYPAAAATATTKAIDFEGSPAPTLSGFGGSEDATVVVDPTNAGNKVARVVKSATAELWAGVTVSTGAGNTIDRIGFAAGKTTITARVWSPAANIPVRMKVEDAADGSKSVETEATVTTASGWQTLTFNFANQVSGTAALNFATNYNRLSVFFDFGTTGAQAGTARTYYIDDIVYPVAGTSGGGSASPLTFSTGFGAGNRTVQGGEYGGFSGSDIDGFNCSGDPAFCGSGGTFAPAVAAADSNFFYYYQTPTPATGLYMGIYVQAPGVVGFNNAGDTAGVQVGSQTALKFKLGQNPEWFGSSTNNFMIVMDLGKRYVVGGNTCRLQLRRVVTPTAQAATDYAIPLSSFALVQDCAGAVTNVAGALAASPISQIAFQGVGGSIALSDGQRTSGANLSVQANGVYPTTIVLVGGITIE